MVVNYAVYELSAQMIASLNLLSMEYPVLFRMWPLFTSVFYLLEFRKTFVVHLISAIYVVCLNLILHYIYV
jgi:hypothetical protein